MHLNQQLRVYFNFFIPEYKERIQGSVDRHVINIFLIMQQQQRQQENVLI